MVHHLTLPTDALDSLQGDATAIPVSDVVIDLAGSGVITCLQGILTNDIVQAGPTGLVWGAVLTPKGMIITDLWVARRGDNATLIVPETGVAALTSLLARSFPPRLAKATLRSDLAVAWITGPAATAPIVDVEQLTPNGPAPFARLAIGPADAVLPHLVAAGLSMAGAERADALRLLGGWPTLGREVDDKTLPQEVRFDELGGVRYDKGCYVGQETVARLHFRGHANRTLRGVRGDGPLPLQFEITAGEGGRELGTVSTVATVPGGWIGMGRIRREAETGSAVMVGGQPATVVGLPFGELG